MANLSNINGKFVVEQTTGYVGVGTTDPNFLIEAAGANSEIALNSTSASIYRLRSTSSDSFIITKNGVGDRLTINGGGDATFAGTLQSGNFAIGAAPSSFGSGVPTITLQGTSANGRGGAIVFKEQDGTVTTNIYSTDGSDGYGTVINAAQGSFRVSVGALAANKLEINSSGNATFAGNVIIHNSSNAPYIDFVENADTGDSKARITMDQIDTNNGTLFFATENAGTLFNQVKITQTGNLLLSNDAASFNTSNAKLNVLPASSGVYQQWNYSPSNDNFSLKLKETVTSGNVRYVFEQINNTTTYPNTLVFNQGNIGIGVTNPGARLELDNPSAFTNMIEYGNVAWNQNTGHGLVAINRGSDGYVQLQITSGVDNADVFTIRNSGTGANIQHNFLSNGNAYHAGNVGIGVSTLNGNGGLMVTNTEGVFANANQKRVASFYDGSVNANNPGIVLGYDDSSTPHGIVAARTQTGSGTIPGLQFFTYDGSWGPRMTILNTGNVGIGTNSPNRKLTIFDGTTNNYLVSAKWYKGDSNFSNPFIVIVSNFTNTSSYPQIIIKINLIGHGISANRAQFTESICTYDLTNGDLQQTTISHKTVGTSAVSAGVFSVSGTSIGFTPLRQTNYDQFKIEADIQSYSATFDY